MNWEPPPVWGSVPEQVCCWWAGQLSEHSLKVEGGPLVQQGLNAVQHFRSLASCLEKAAAALLLLGPGVSLVLMPRPLNPQSPDRRENQWANLGLLGGLAHRMDGQRP